MVRKWKWYLLTKGTLESLTHPFKEATQELSLHSPTRTQVTPPRRGRRVAVETPSPPPAPPRGGKVQTV